MKYIAGTTVQGKRRTKSYKIHKVEEVAREEWIRVENTHEAIIDKKTFAKAQEINRQDTKISQKTKELAVWAGFLKCEDCRRAMNKKSSTNKKGNKYEYYICSTYRKKSNNMCTKHSIKVENLEGAVLKAINYHINCLIDIKDLIMQLEKNKVYTGRTKSIEDMIKIKQNDICKISNFKRTLYEDWKNENITKEEYFDYKQKYENDIEKIKMNIEKLQSEKQTYELKDKLHNEWIENFKSKKAITELSRIIMTELINCIYVHENGDIKISFKFKV